MTCGMTWYRQFESYTLNPLTMKKSIWQEFFDSHAPDYMENVFTKNTDFEVEFIMRELGLVSGDRVLDVGCGTGRHSIPLASKGMEMTGLDLSEGMLAEARKYAESENASIELVQADATQFHFPEASNVFKHQ